MYDMRELTSLRDTYSKDKKTLDEMIDNEISDIRRTIKDLSLELWILYTREELVDLIVSTETLLRDAKRVNNLKNMNNGDKTLDELNTLLVSLESDHHICPSCDTGLFLRNDVLTICKTKPSKIHDGPDILSVKKSIETLKEIDDITDSYEDDIPLVESIIEDLTYLKEYEFSQIQNEKTVKSLNRKLKHRQLSHTCLTFEQKVNTLEKRIASFDIKTVHSTDMTEASMRELVDEQKRIKFKTDDINSKIYEYEDLKKTYIESNSLLVNGDINDSIIHLDKLRTDLGSLINDQKNIEKRVIFEENRERLNEKLKIYQRIEARVLNLQKEETLRRNEYGALMTLKENILEAESIAITSIVESINTHAKVYLDKFFEDDPIIVRLQAFKHVKKTIKPQINIEIEYKDMDCDLQMMSGGEMARVVLAYTLALAEMFNTPLLLLDECTASLDQETTSDVFDAIKENFNGKLTIIVAHQVVTGIFDRSIDLK
jgi:excinuclease UvrABC ATPase subunit